MPEGESGAHAAVVPTKPTYVRNGIRIAPEHDAASVQAPLRRGARKSVPQRDVPVTTATPTDTISFVHPTSQLSARIEIGDCRDLLANMPEVQRSELDLVFADPPFNWSRAYDQWNDALPEDAYLKFTYEWLDLCVRGLRPGGALWVNIPDNWAAEIVCYLKGRTLDPVTHRARPLPDKITMTMQNWCVWHYRFGQNTTDRFINSKVHALYFIKAGGEHTWKPDGVLELSDRAAIYGDARTLSKKDGMPASMRVPMDVWYGKYFGRVQGNNSERRNYHDNQLPEAYLERVIEACSKQGDLVLDPFLGSGTTGVMAHAMGRRFIGTEFSPDNARLAAERIRDIGPARPLGSTRGQSSAIFGSRRARPKA